MIVCGTDLSEAAAEAASCAAHLAARGNVPLLLVHALEVGPEEIFDEPRPMMAEAARRALEKEAERLRALGARVEVQLAAAPADEALLEVSRARTGVLLVVAAVGRRAGTGWRLGSTADRIAQRAGLPVLVARGEGGFAAWARGERPLRVAVGVDPSWSTEVALRWVVEFSRFGPTELVGIHLYWPPEQFARLGLGGVRSLVDPDPVVDRVLQQELSAHLAKVAGLPPLRLRTEPSLGDPGFRLSRVAEEERADLVVVGSHGRRLLARLWEGSISRSVLRESSVAVAVVPTLPAERAHQLQRVHSVLAATDLSALGDQAVAQAYAVVAPGGTVRLVHVIRGRTSHELEPHDLLTYGTPEHREEKARAQKHLRQLVPKEAAQAEVRTEVYVLEAPEVAEAICQAAERLGTELLCLGTQGRTGAAKLVLGSVAQAVLARTLRPLLLARAPLE
jgi:nucleotide-binding universal stress UspA family protein